MNHSHDKSLIEECRRKLLLVKMDLLNRSKLLAANFAFSTQARERSGDEIDQSSAQLEEHSFLVSQERLRLQLSEIEAALSRIESGSYGICEETGELIERDRLLAIPWTRLSIEGAEIREAIKRRYAR
ncbi:MAG: TraR/DksA family transcriptional regulator [Bdellovibrionaceae bacterium]|nr:TraR/DksA family transcriptional regulator [Pseudobdellovibrionaceae bacterium]